MDTEDLGPSQEEMGIDSNDNLTGSSTSKETDQKESDLFEKFANKNLSPGGEMVDVEKEKLFVIEKIEKAEESDVYRRTYFAQAIVQRSEEISFQGVAEAFIKEDQEVSFVKTGRSTYHWDETETLEFTNEHREDKNEFDLAYTLMDIKEDERGSNETEGSSFSVIYDPKGDLFFVTPSHKDLPFQASFTSNYMGVDQDNVEAMEEFKQAAKEGSTLEASGMKLGVSYSPDKKDFIFTMYNKQGDADYTVTVPLHVNVTEIMEETGALNLLRNPTQPSEGIQGQGIGDTDWRYKSFSELTGVKLTAAKL